MWLKQNVDYVKAYTRRHPESFKPCRICGKLPTVDIRRLHDHYGNATIFCEQHPFKTATAEGDDILSTIDKAAAKWRRLNGKPRRSAHQEA